MFRFNRTIFEIELYKRLNMTLKEDYGLALDVFLHKWESVREIHYKEKLPNLPIPRLTVESGRKYDKIVEIGQHQHYVKCFVEKSTGYILKAASFKKPAKGPRASIFEPKSYEKLNAYTGWLYKRYIGQNNYDPTTTADNS